MKRAPATAILLLCLAPSAAFAHHSLAPYIRTTGESVIGKVKEFAWTNPHTRIVLLVPGEGGATVEWNFEGVGTARLARAGFKKDMMVRGDMIAVGFHPRRDKTPGGLFFSVTLSDGSILRLDRRQQSGVQTIE
jgi:uncharacterized protein DUF6152